MPALLPVGFPTSSNGARRPASTLARALRPAALALTVALIAAGGCSGEKAATAAPASRAADAGSAPAAAAPTPPGAAGRPALTVTVTTPRTEPLRRTLPVTGAIAAWQEIVIAPEVGGYLVASVRADVGSVVKKGQTLATLRTDLLGADVAARRAAREQARAALANAQSVLRRAESLRDTGAVSDEELDRLSTEVLTAQARMQSAEAELSTARLRSDKARIVAPDAGTIVSRSVTVGQVAQPANEMFRLMRQGRLEWRAEVPEARLREVRIGQAVRMRAADGTRFAGRVRMVAPTVRPDDRSALVYVDVAPGAAVRPGQFAQGEFDLGSVEALTVPMSALVTQDGMQYVFVVDADDRVQRRRLQIGTTQGDMVEVTDGLRPTDRVVVQGAGYLRDGDRVAVAQVPGAGQAAAPAAGQAAASGVPPVAAPGASPATSPSSSAAPAASPASVQAQAQPAARAK